MSESPAPLTTGDVLWIENVDLVGCSMPSIVRGLYPPGTTPPVVVRATKDWLTVEVVEAQPALGRRGEAGSPRLYVLDMAAVKTVHIDEWCTARPDYRCRPMIRFLTGPPTLGETSGMVIVCHTGEWFLFRLVGSASAARSRAARLLAHIGAD